MYSLILGLLEMYNTGTPSFLGTILYFLIVLYVSYGCNTCNIEYEFQS